MTNLDPETVIIGGLEITLPELTGRSGNQITYGRDMRTQQIQRAGERIVDYARDQDELAVAVEWLKKLLPRHLEAKHWIDIPEIGDMYCHRIEIELRQRRKDLAATSPQDLDD